MEANRAIPTGYMTVGEVAEKMGVTVRTLQYYDREQLLPPSGESAGGRRLYTDKDLIRLHQILALKSLGFSLNDIRGRLISLNTPEEVAAALSAQAEEISSKIDTLSESLRAILQLREEVLQMQSVDFKKYADIIVNLQMKNEYYFLLKKFDDETLDHIRSHFDKDSGLDFIHRFNRLCDEILILQQEQVPPESEACQKLTKKYWDMITEFTGGDPGILSKLMELGNVTEDGDAWEQRQALVNSYLEPALEFYFSSQGIAPFPEV